MNILHLNILGALLDNKNTIRTELRPKKDKIIRYTNPDTGETYPLQTWTDVSVTVPVPALAGNVSNLNCDIAAKRWMPV